MLKSQLTHHLILAPTRYTTAIASAFAHNNNNNKNKNKKPSLHPPAAASMTTDAAPPSSGQRQQAMLASQRASEQQQSHSTPDERLSAPVTRFPLGYKEAAQQWWSSISSSAAERKVLSYVPMLKEAASSSSSSDGPDPFGVRRIWRTQLVQLSGKNRALNEYSVERVGEPVEDTLVMLHGYGAGLGFFYRNFEPLTRVPGWRLYALDMLGMGNSSRPSFHIQARDAKGKIAESESWFVDSLEEWRRIRGIERFTLFGHSLGGYLAVSYALKYPGKINKLILCSPVGIPEDPFAVNDQLPEPETSTLANEFTQDQRSIASGRSGSSTGDNNNDDNSKNNKSNKNNNSSSSSTNNNNGSGSGSSRTNRTTTRATTAAKPERRPIPGWLVWLWDANVSPFSVVRASGPLGPRLVLSWTSRRFNHLPAAEAQDLHTYAYTLFRQRGSGEYALPYLLAPGAYARSPVIHRIQDVGRQPLGPGRRETGFPIVMMYGDRDWMDVAGGYAAEQKIKRRVVQALLTGTDQEKRRENGSASVIIVSRAGHHLYLDNSDEFNDAMIRELEDTRAYGQRQRAMQD